MVRNDSVQRSCWPPKFHFPALCPLLRFWVLFCWFNQAWPSPFPSFGRENCILWAFAVRGKSKKHIPNCLMWKVFYKFTWRYGTGVGLSLVMAELGDSEVPRSWSINIFDLSLLFLSLASFSDSICWHDDCISSFQFHVRVEREPVHLLVAPENVLLGLA